MNTLQYCIGIIRNYGPFICHQAELKLCLVRVKCILAEQNHLDWLLLTVNNQRSSYSPQDSAIQLWMTVRSQPRRRRLLLPVISIFFLHFHHQHHCDQRYSVHTFRPVVSSRPTSCFIQLKTFNLVSLPLSAEGRQKNASLQLICSAH